MVALLVFIIAALEKVFGRQKLLDAKGPPGDNVIKKGVDIVLTQRMACQETFFYL